MKIPADPGVIEYLESYEYLIDNDQSDHIWLRGIVNSYTSWYNKYGCIYNGDSAVDTNYEGVVTLTITINNSFAEGVEQNAH